MATTFRERRNELGRTIAQCARAFGVHRNTAANWDSGRNGPDEEHAEAVARFVAGKSTLAWDDGRWQLVTVEDVPSVANEDVRVLLQRLVAAVERIAEGLESAEGRERKAR